MPVLENNSTVHHHVHKDNLYNSMMLSENLKQHNISVCVCVCGTTRSNTGIPKDLKEAKERKKGQSSVTIKCHDSPTVERKRWGKNQKATEDKQNCIEIKHYMKMLNPDPEVRSCGRVQNVFISPLPPSTRSIKSV
jgi:hypothetical protein